MDEVGYGSQRGTNLVQQQTAFAMSAESPNRSVCCHPSFSSSTRQLRRSSKSRCTVAVLSGPQLYDYALNNIEPLLEGIPA